MKLESEDKKRLVDAYKAFFADLMQEKQGTMLTEAELKAIGQRAFDELLEKAFSKFEFSNNEKEEIKEILEELIIKECPNESLASPLAYDHERKLFLKK